MKKNLIIIISIVFFPSFLKSQNLFSNPDFELYSNCPIDQNGVDSAIDWVSIIASPDYMNCSYNCWTGQAIVGAQSGTGYMGFASYGFSLATEAIAQQLTSPLVTGNTYNIFLYAKKTTGPNYADNCGGVCFYGWTGNPFTITPPIGGICPEDSGGTLLGCTDSVTNTLWQPYVATFVAPAAFDFIGMAVGCTGNLCGEYVFVDNLNFVISSVSENQEGLTDIKVFQDADRGYLNVSFKLLKKANVRFSLITVPGKTVLVKEKNLYSGVVNEQLAVSSFSDGIYFLKIETDHAQFVHKVFVKN